MLLSSCGSKMEFFLAASIHSFSLASFATLQEGELFPWFLVWYIFFPEDKLQNVLFDAGNTTTVIASELDCLEWSFIMNFYNFSTRNFFKEWCALTNYFNGCIFDHSYCLLLQVFYANGLSKYYTHQIACYLPSRADVLPNDISAKQPGYACVLANVLEAATWILSEPKFASDRVRV